MNIDELFDKAETHPIAFIATMWIGGALLSIVMLVVAVLVVVGVLNLVGVL